MAFVRTPRRQWIERGMAALATGGPDAVRIEVLARELGVAKGGFYGHFVDRQAPLDEVLDLWERSSVDDVIRRIEAEGGDGRSRLRRLFSIASPDARDPHRIDLAVRQWARHDRDVAIKVLLGESPLDATTRGKLSNLEAELAEAYTSGTGAQWTQPIGFAHSLIEVAMDVFSRTEDIDDRESVLAAVTGTQIDTIVGPVSWSGGGPSNPVPNVSTTPLVGGQWVLGGDFKYDLVIADNSLSPDIPTTATIKAIGS